MSLFALRGAHLAYRPHEKFELPELHRIEDADGEPAFGVIKYKTARGKSAETRQTSKPLYRLRWPGELWSHADAAVDALPSAVQERWPSKPPTPPPAEWPMAKAMKYVPVNEYAIAYHLAVNRRYFDGATPLPVAGLPAERVNEVLDATFAIDDHAFAAIQYLKLLAENHRDVTLFRGFDTAIRDELGDISVRAVQLYFLLVGDHGYSTDNLWWQRNGWWQYMACYLFWVGRTGVGLWRSFANLPTDGYRLDLLRSEVPGLVEALDAWDSARLQPLPNVTPPDGKPQLTSRRRQRVVRTSR